MGELWSFRDIHIQHRLNRSSVCCPCQFKHKLLAHYEDGAAAPETCRVVANSESLHMTVRHMWHIGMCTARLARMPACIVQQQQHLCNSSIEMNHIQAASPTINARAGL